MTPKLMKRFIKLTIRFFVVMLLLSASVFGAVVYYMTPVTSVIAWIGFVTMVVAFGGALHYILK